MSKGGRPIVNITGCVFGSVTVTKIAYRDKNGYVFWECKCDCGSYTVGTYTDLRRGRNNECSKCRDVKSKLSPLKTLYGSYRRGAEMRNLAFDLTIEEFEIIITKDCYYCYSKPLQFLKKEKSRYGITYNGIDRKDNEIGYTLENSLPCCKFCNFAKRGDTEENFKAWLNRVKNNTPPSTE